VSACFSVEIAGQQRKARCAYPTPTAAKVSMQRDEDLKSTLDAISEPYPLAVRV